MNVSTSFKFYTKLRPVAKNNAKMTGLFQWGNIVMFQKENNETINLYVKMESATDYDYIMEELDIPDYGWLNVPKNDDDSAVTNTGSSQLIGMRLKVITKQQSTPAKQQNTPAEQQSTLTKQQSTPTEQQNTPPEEFPWFMIGIDYVKHPDRQGHLNFYFNGKLVKNEVVNEDQFIYLGDTALVRLSNARYSCIEFHQHTQKKEYFENLQLNECSKYIYQAIIPKYFIPKLLSSRHYFISINPKH